MNKIKQIIAAAFAVFLLQPLAALAQDTTDPSVYGALPDVIQMEISPDGKTIASLQVIDGQGVLVFLSVDDPNAAPTGVRVGSTKARTIEWADNEHVLLLLSQSERVRLVGGLETLEFFRWISVSKSTQDSNILFGNESGYYISDPGSYIATIPNESGKALFSRISTRGRYQRNQTGTRLKQDDNIVYSTFVVDLENGRTRLKDGGGEHTVDWIAGPDGEPFARIDYNDGQEQRELYVKQPGDSSYTLIKAWPEKRGAGRVISFHGLLDDTGAALAASTYSNKGRQSVVAVNSATGEIERTLFENPGYDISSVLYNPRTAQATATRFIDDLPRTYHFSEDYRTLQEQLRGAIPGAAPMIVSKSRDGARMIVEAVYTDHPKQFFLFDRNEMRMDMIDSSYRRLDGSVSAIKEKFDYVSSDGLTIPGYLTVPAGAAKQNMPLIVLPHGGPESRADQSFDYWSFFYASRGYLVYEPNFRGSDGYGFEFKSAGFGEWGRKMQNDITEGVEKLIADGVADPDRICIAGASYGGYAALAGATLTPDLYACAVSVNGVSDLPAMLGDESKQSPLSEDYWEVRMGGSRFSPAELNAVSPAENADKAGAPILLIHAKDDVVVPTSQSRIMRNALRGADKPHEYVELDGEDHWLSTGEMRTEMLRRSIDFIDKHIGN
ncbi:alpha/beta hydrolase family protein [Hyphococcus sp.]|uniref:alpha/beta hydrolase family protein n=1 Tax=Hyphococcus sp. TaxID=2038636 RepID=UPI003CCC263B